MPQGDKGKYTDKQKRMERHIEKGYEQRGRGEEEARAARLGDRERADGRRQQAGRLGTRQARHEQRQHVERGTQPRREEGLGDAPA